MTQDQFNKLVMQRAVQLEQRVMEDFNFPINGAVHQPTEASIRLASQQIVDEWNAFVKEQQQFAEPSRLQLLADIHELDEDEDDT